MDWGGPGFVVAIIAISTIGWIVNNWIRAKHGYSLEDEWGGKTEKASERDDAKLREMNQQLMQTMEKMQDRMIVLERIVTDKGYTVAEEIEALRDKPANNASAAGVPLNFDKKEQV
ncbi:hypothetical protein [Erythrobacter alti]|uniref:hypothetical protein n=1 Tax=Erythrobacter alti TaxID=1896145 RepID=UPI0030F40D55